MQMQINAKQCAKLGDNDQQAWLESLFFQDTTHLPGRVGPQDQLSQTNTNPKNTLRVNSSTNSRPEVERKNRRTDEETVTAVHVNDKMKNVAQDFFKDSRKEGSKKSSNQNAEKSAGHKFPMHISKILKTQKLAARLPTLLMAACMKHQA